jgi:hypothetical protein
MENQGFPTICIEKIMMKFLKKVISNEITLGDVKDFYEETQKEKKELEESYQESLRQTQERKEKDGN